MSRGGGPRLRLEKRVVTWREGVRWFERRLMDQLIDVCASARLVDVAYIPSLMRYLGIPNLSFLLMNSFSSPRCKVIIHLPCSHFGCTSFRSQCRKTSSQDGQTQRYTQKSGSIIDITCLHKSRQKYPKLLYKIPFSMLNKAN